jgi:membrane protease YdiL (CAAX protease family)
MTASGSNSTGGVLVLIMLVLTVFITVASYFFVLLMGYGFIFFTPQGSVLGMESRNFPILVFFLIGFYTPLLYVGSVFSFIWLIFVVCFIAAWKWRESFHTVVAESFSRRWRDLFRNFLFIMPLISSMVLVAVSAIISIQDFFGIPTGQVSFPSGTPIQEVFLNVAYAPIIEELGFRLIPIGLFTLFHVLLAGRNVSGHRFNLLVTSFLYPEQAKRTAGLRNVRDHGIQAGISVGEWAMIIITSVIFGLAHVISGIGWQVGKVTSVFVQAIFFAITYLAYGFEAPILLHWFFNYYVFFFDPDIVTKFFPGTAPILSVIEFIIIVIGVFGWAAFAVTGVRRLRARTKIKQEVNRQQFTLPPEFP